MTDLERLYQQFVARGFPRRAALAACAEALDVDKETVRRSLQRARENDARGLPRRPKREEQS